MREELESLERDYFDQPLMGRRTDLVVINALRMKLGLPQVDEQLVPIRRVIEAVSLPEKKDGKTYLIDKHLRAREVYQDYLKKKEELEPHQRYAISVEKATGGTSMTPVEPLATMGTNGGPLLCDHCGKPMILEGGRFHKRYADAAWDENPQPGWKSFISGGMVVELVDNRTIRIYHGYISKGSPQDCCNIAYREMEEKRNQYRSHDWKAACKMLTEFFRDEYPMMTDDRERAALVNDILDLMFRFDPGIGVNRPIGY